MEVALLGKFERAQYGSSRLLYLWIRVQKVTRDTKNLEIIAVYRFRNCLVQSYGNKINDIVLLETVAIIAVVKLYPITVPNEGTC